MAASVSIHPAIFSNATAIAAGLEPGREREVPLGEATLSRLGWSRMVATLEIRPRSIAPLLSELAIEDCAHSWRRDLADLVDLDAREAVPELMKRASVQRPTVLFTYEGHTRFGGRETVALATISERVDAAFPYAGYPVLARCFIRRAYRGLGLYREILRHRWHRCRHYWGEELRAVHIGSANAAVVYALTASDRDLPPFVQIGYEHLPVGERTWRVVDFLAFAPRFHRDALDDLARLRGVHPQPPEVRDLLRAFSDFVRVGAAAVPFQELGDHARRALARLDLERGELPALDALLALGEHIGLAG